VHLLDGNRVGFIIDLDFESSQSNSLPYLPDISWVLATVRHLDDDPRVLLSWRLLGALALSTAATTAAIFSNSLIDDFSRGNISFR
jgi:hypothetical protein